MRTVGKKGESFRGLIEAPSSVKNLGHHFCAARASPYLLPELGKVSGHDSLRLFKDVEYQAKKSSF